jgi:hypothetical protein
MNCMTLIMELDDIYLAFIDIFWFVDKMEHISRGLVHITTFMSSVFIVF